MLVKLFINESPDELKTLIKKCVRDLKLWWSLQLCGQLLVDHNPDMSQWCHCYHFPG